MNCPFVTTPTADGRYRHECPKCGRVLTLRSEQATAKCRAARGPGTLLKKLTTALGIKPCGGCEKRAAAMDAAWAKLTGKD